MLQQRYDGRRAFTILELLVVILIVGLLIALLLPAVQSAREASRRSTCHARIRQLALALLVHHDSKQHFPYGGWGRRWSGVPGRGSAEKQPGGWIYGILPQLEQHALYELGSIGSDAERELAYSRRMQTPIPVLNCPSRREVSLLPVSKNYAINPLPYGDALATARSDYAINSGSSQVVTFPGPSTFEEGDSEQWWLTNGTATFLKSEFSGIIHYREAVSLQSVTDGSSNTYLVGGKHLKIEHYATGLSPGDDASPYTGYSFNTHRFTAGDLKGGGTLYLPPLQDADSEPNVDLPFARFGGPHQSTFQVAFCDGAVHAMHFDIAAEVHRRLGGRDDGELLASPFN